ncbi:hypothetical protein E2C01_074860 [Portunus trituberculatus]|uniref:Uncharacterized protein n=1 Tax=Portunus trituberculatus TaxID=210409 RepID=A0A5B7IIB5_PORTR|nr:hypothetical protein [Portunus trituberculatus]
MRAGTRDRVELLSGGRGMTHNSVFPPVKVLPDASGDSTTTTTTNTASTFTPSCQRNVFRPALQLEHFHGQESSGKRSHLDCNCP